MDKGEKYLKQWTMPSSQGGGDYIISLISGNPDRPNAPENKFACSCPGWTRNVAKFCPVCGSRLGKGKPPHCWKCNKDIEAPRVERIECKHIAGGSGVTGVRYGGGTELVDAVMDIMMGRHK